MPAAIPPLIPPIFAASGSGAQGRASLCRGGGARRDCCSSVVASRKFPKEHRAETAINLESFLGVKLFAWLGGFLLFLAVAFFIKHAFEKNLITPLMRITFGYIAGIGLVVGGLVYSARTARGDSPDFVRDGTRGALCEHFCVARDVPFHRADGCVFADGGRDGDGVRAGVEVERTSRGGAGPARRVSHANPVARAHRQRAGVVRLPGVARSGIARDCAATALESSHRAGAVATVGMQYLWVQQFFIPAKYGVANTIFLGFAALFVAAFGVANYFKRVEQFLSAAVFMVLSGALIFPLYILWHPWRELAQNVIPLFTFVFLIDAGFLAIAWWRDELRLAPLASGGAVFLLLSSWTAQYLTPRR
jgi:hypothetical protein